MTPTEELLTDTGVKWSTRPISLDSINVEQSLANQVRSQPLDQAVVEDYAAAMERGDAFPPVIVEEHEGQRWLLGGNHRFHARSKAGFETIDAHVIDNPSEQQAKEIAFGDNSTHGQPLTNAERLGHADYLIENGMTQSDAAAHVGVSLNRLQRHVAVKQTRRRWVELNEGEYSLVHGLSPVTMSRLAAIADDDTFSTTTRAVATYQIPTRVVYEFVTQLNKLDTPQEKQAKAKEFAADHAATGSRDRSSGRTKRTELHRLSDALIELASVDFDEAAKHVWAKDRHIWDRRLREAAQRLFDMKKKVC